MNKDLRQSRTVCALLALLCSFVSSARSASSSDEFHQTHFFPETVALQYGTLSLVKCSGTLIGPSTIVTAAHCVCKDLPTAVFLGTNPNPDLGQDPGYQQVRGVHSVLLYSLEYCEALAENRIDDLEDLAVVHTNQPFDLQNLDFLPQLADKTEEAVLRTSLSTLTVYGAGFGKTDNADWSGAKHAYKVLTRFCDSGTAVSTGCRPGAEIVTVDESDTDTCEGDSGGPVFVGINETMKILGITSRGRTDRELICGDGGIFILITKPSISEWLNKQRR